METIGKSSIWSFRKSTPTAVEIENDEIRKDPGHKVRSYMELARKVAELQYRNRDFVLLFRGQGGDYFDSKDMSTLKASLFRPEKGRVHHPNSDVLVRRFQKLRAAEQHLRDFWHSDLLGEEYVKRYRVLRWAILQHYEVCYTPLLDVTHSLRIAASFASLGASPKAYLYVLAVPYLSGAITASAESGMQIVRLSSVCPPNAVRPHIQEGYLLGEYPEMIDYDQKENYHHYEIDFGRRLVAKFYFNPKTFWSRDDFQPVGKEVLYPSKTQDPFYRTALQVADATKGWN